jgi:uncharacterized protein (DUF983 family)
MRVRTLIYRALRLRCPLCGQGALFQHLFRMNQRCPHCGINFNREPGFFLGSIYINYGLTSLIVVVVYPILLFNKFATQTQLLIASLTFVAIFPILLLPYARSLWLAFDQYHDPRPGEVGTGKTP